LGFALFFPDIRMKNFGEREGFTMVNLAQNIQVYADKHKIFLLGFNFTLSKGHWNTRGHRLAGETIAENLCEAYCC
jgi:hypothetical protein